MRPALKDDNDLQGWSVLGAERRNDAMNRQKERCGKLLGLDGCVCAEASSCWGEKWAQRQVGGREDPRSGWWNGATFWGSFDYPDGSQ